MTIHDTESGLKKLIKQLNQTTKQSVQEKYQLHQTYICKPLAPPFFPDVELPDIQNHLLRHGLFSPQTSPDVLTDWLKNDYNSKIERLYQKCKATWDGPATNIFVLPSNEEIRELKEWFDSNAGLSYPNKLFLFLSTSASSKELTALFLHEYSHTCRLDNFPKEESSYTLLDAVILEGIAEWIVRKLLGKSYGNKRVKWVPDQTFLNMWKKWVEPNSDIPRTHLKHDMVMYGGSGISKNAGYLIGYNLIHRYMAKNNQGSKALLKLSNEKILASIDLFSDKN
ncbi:hypothetical protein JCM21714_1086 [Gracilibacillus boraciitolerans JCM 21714]|uniref:DUF2268 domain-containing protein n=1 Tax=Gracilibacillus boraciitolerans JCM 21714 TaxID=1298598 RepID=W4VFC2_9BACI|nr:DUF2268 domain-containing putative Zn-dependent protease [Gracilibacillus boraciitolerans]GAE92105.1 hypothetical protein JCM21714_1086 [Gracilibacillus boraciitolerans JCM 21714]